MPANQAQNPYDQSPNVANSAPQATSVGVTQKPLVEKAKKLVNEHPFITIIIVVLLIILVAVYFDYIPLSQLTPMTKNGETFKGKKSDDTLSAIAQGF
jgi:hypothetical protein